MASSSSANDDNCRAVPYEPPPPYSQKANEAGTGAPGQPPPGGYPYAYPPPHPQPVQPQQVGGAQTTVIVTEPIAVTSVYGFAYVPVSTTCPHCQNNIVTQIHYEPGALTWFIFALLIFLCCWIFAWIPFVDTNTKDVVHTCPRCGAVVGKFRRM